MSKAILFIIGNNLKNHLNISWSGFLMLVIWVLDPLARAGTVLKVSKDLKRKCIAIDKNKECVEIMRGRLLIK